MPADLEYSELLAKFGSRIVTAAVALVVLILIFSSYTVISPGNTGVIFNMWTGSLRAVPQGIAWRMPWITQVQSYPTALRTYTMVARQGEGSAESDDSIDLPTREGQHIRQDISVTYNTTEDKAADVFKAFRGADISDIESTFIRRTIITAAQNAAGQMSLSEVISSQRNELQITIQKNLVDELSKMGFNLDKVNLGASHLPRVAREADAAENGGAAAGPAGRVRAPEAADARQSRGREGRGRGAGDPRARQGAGRGEPNAADLAHAGPDPEQGDREVGRRLAPGIRREHAIHRYPRAEGLGEKRRRVARRTGCKRTLHAEKT